MCSQERRLFGRSAVSSNVRLPGVSSFYGTRAMYNSVTHTDVRPRSLDNA